MSKVGKRISNDIKLFWHSLFYGLRAADSVMQSQSNGVEGIEINEQVKPSGPYADMLEQKVTKEVEELRDKHYRVLKEADKYDASTLTLKEEEIINEEGKLETVLTFSGGVRRKTKEDFMKHTPVFEKEGNYLLRVIQDNKHYEKQSMFNNYYTPNGLYDYDTLITIDRGDIIPRFEIEKFAKKVVVRNVLDTDRAEVDFYLPTEAGQFTKTDAILVSNLYQMFESKNLKSDITDIRGIEWNCDHAWNADDLNLFKYDDIKPLEMNVFDGNFVITFDCHIVENGTDITEKFKTKDLDEKYKYKAPKEGGVSIMAAERRAKEDEKKEIDTENMGATTFKLS